MNKEIQTIVKTLRMQKLWDDDFIKEDYCSPINIPVENGSKIRPLFNWAYYLIPEGSFFPLHKLLSDESWHYCLGGPIDLFIIKNGEIETIRIGPNIFQGELLFYIVPSNTWFAASPIPNSTFSLISHCVSPGWHPDDDIAGFYEEMIKLAPKHPEFIKKYSWPSNRKVYSRHDSYKNGFIN